MSETSKRNSALIRLASLFDDGSFVEIDAQSPSGAKAGYGSVGGATVFAFCQDSAVDGGAVDMVHARKLAKIYDLAAKTGSPVITIYDSNGVKIDDGFASLQASSEILRKVSELSGVVPQIAVVVGPCGGFSAIAAGMADFCIMAEGAEMFLTPAFTDKAGGGKTKDVGSLQFAEKAGVAAISCESETAALVKASDIARLLPLNNLAALPAGEGTAPVFTTDKCPIETICDEGSATVLYAGMGESSRIALATIGGMPCGVITARGELDRGDTAKCARLIEICDSFNIPIVSFITSEGFSKSAENDIYDGIRSAAKLAHVLAEATSPKITVITQSAIGSIYSVFCGKNAGCDMSFAWEGAVISPINTAAAASLIWEDKIKKSADIDTLAKEYGSTVAGAQQAAQAGAIDAVIAPQDTRQQLVFALDMLSSKRVSRMPKKHGNMPL